MITGASFTQEKNTSLSFDISPKRKGAMDLKLKI